MTESKDTEPPQKKPAATPVRPSDRELGEFEKRGGWDLVDTSPPPRAQAAPPDPPPSNPPSEGGGGGE